MSLPYPHSLDLAWAHRLTLVLGPAGAGKTRLLRCSLDDRSGHVAWVSLQDEHNDPELFAGALVAAFKETCLPGTDLEPPSPGTRRLAGWSDFAVELLNALADLESDFMLVLDGFDAIENDTVIGLVAYLVENEPPRLHTILVAHSEPPLPLARLRVRRQLLTIVLRARA